MKRCYYITFIYILLLLPAVVCGQERHTFSVSYSPVSLRGMQYHWKEGTHGRKVTIIPGEYGYRAVGYDKSYPGMLMLSYSYRFADKVKAGLDVGYEAVKKKWDVYERPEGPQTVNQQIHSLYFLPGVSYIYLSNPQVSLSSSAQAGAAYAWSDFRYTSAKDKSDVSFAAQVWLANLQVKYRSFALTGDIGFGSVGFFRIGLAYNL